MTGPFTYPPLRAIIFDMDGTLYQNPSLNQAYLRSFLLSVAHAKKVSLKTAETIFRETMHKYQQTLRRQPSHLYVLSQMGIADTAWARIHGRVAPAKWLRPDPRLQRALRQLRQYFRLALLTNNHRDNTMETLQALGVADQFDFIQTLTESRRFKPDPKLYREMATRLGVDPRECLSIGDRFDLDLAPAARVGMHTLLIKQVREIYALFQRVQPKMARRLRLTNKPSPTLLARIGQVVKSGGLLVIPTDTVYGIAARPEAEAVHWIYRAKGRPENNPLPILLADQRQAARFVKISAAAKSLMAKHWPGALTLVLPAKPGTPWGKITRGGRWLALRVPGHAGVREVLRHAGGALVTTSANPSGEAAPGSPDDVKPQILSFAELMLDAGPCVHGTPSTIARVGSNRIEILRQGSLDLSAGQFAQK